MDIGYIRISTTDQNTARQAVLMQELGVDQVYIDRMGRKTTERPEFQGGRQWRGEKTRGGGR